MSDPESRWFVNKHLGSTSSVLTPSKTTSKRYSQMRVPISKTLRWYHVACYTQKDGMCVDFLWMLSFVTTLSIPSDDFGGLDTHFRVRFRSTFQRLTPLKSASKTHSEMRVQSSKIIAWGS